MDSATLILLGIGLFIAWIIGPVAVLHYRIITVPRRYKEIHDRFMSSNPGEHLASLGDRQQSGAWHYARLLDPDADLGQSGADESVLHQQFWRFHDWSRYCLPLSFVILLSAIMLAFSGLWLAHRLCPSAPPAAAEKPTAPLIDPSSNNAGSATIANPPKPAQPPSGTGAAVPTDTKAATHVLDRIPPPFLMALWGAYVWSLYEILSRRKSGDLTPVELYDIASRYVTAIPVGYAFSLLVFDTVPALAAFAVSAFPLRDIRQFFRKYALKKLDEKSTPAVFPSAAPHTAVFPTPTKGYLGDTMNGMGNDTIARLEELNIETYMDLAYADPIKLLIKTGVPIELVLSWIDQALVSVYAAPHKGTLSACGMPCALDICEFYARHCWDVATNDYRPTWKTDPEVLALAVKLGVPEAFLVQQILRGIYEDPHTRLLVRIWFGPARTADAL